MDALSILKRHLSSNPELFETVYLHSRHVMLKALDLADRHPELSMDRNFIEEAALLHDIGVYRTNAPDIHCLGTFPYICHGYLGREIMDQEGLPRHGLVCERHTGTGLYLAEILDQNLPLPHRDLVPVSLEEKIICFADKFYSKTQLEKEFSIEEVRSKLIKYGPEGVNRFDRWCEMFL